VALRFVKKPDKVPRRYDPSPRSNRDFPDELSARLTIAEVSLSGMLMRRGLARVARFPLVGAC
jgi:hypothetical protein